MGPQEEESGMEGPPSDSNSLRAPEENLHPLVETELPKAIVDCLAEEETRYNQLCDGLPCVDLDFP